MNNQSGPDGCTEQTSGLDLLVGPPRAHSVRMGASCARARGALHAHVYSIQICFLAHLQTNFYKIDVVNPSLGVIYFFTNQAQI